MAWSRLAAAVAVGVLFIGAHPVAAQDFRHSADALDCYLREFTTICTQPVTDRLTPYSCKSSDGRYYNFHHLDYLTYPFLLTITVTSSDFSPAVIFAVGPTNPARRLAFDANAHGSPTAQVRYALTDVTPDYYVEVESSLASAAPTGSYQLDVHCEYCTAPIITLCPRDTTIPYSGKAHLTVDAYGVEPISFTWREVGNELVVVATGQDFTTPQLTNSTAYYVDLNNDCGTARTAAAKVTVQPWKKRRPVRH